MATFGKVLLFLNVMLAVIVLTFFGLNVGQEKRWSTALFIHEIHFTGLPTDANEVDAGDPAVKRVDKLTRPVLTALFDFADDPELGRKAQVKTVLEELDRVRTAVQANVTGAANETEQRKLLALYLVPQAKTIIEREELLRRCNDPKESVANLIAELNRRFDEAKNPPGRITTDQNRREQRLNIATLLFNLHVNSPWRQRLMRIVGMETYVEAVERQAQFTFAIAREYRVLITQDQTAFEKSYADLVDVILKDSEDLYYLDKYLRDLNATLAERHQQVKLRETEVANAQTALTKSTNLTKVEVDKLNAIQYDLFQLQVRLGQAIDKNQQLELELRKLETKKPGL